jgi:RNA polymerase sigma-70 factor, ECF subfamily
MLEPSVQSQTLDPTVHLRRPPASAADTLPDLLLIERSRSGDERAIEALIRRYGRRLLRVARSVLWDDERADAAVQDAYVAAFADLSRYEPTGKFAAWLTRLAYSRARALQVSARATPAAVVALTPLDAEAGRRELESAIGRLPEVFRTVYVLRMVEGISGIETAACLGLHETTVRTRLFRAHRRLMSDAGQRLPTTPGVLEVTPERIDRLVQSALAQLPHGSMLTSCVSPP